MDAQATCSGDGAMLAEPRNQQENDYIGGKRLYTTNPTNSFKIASEIHGLEVLRDLI